MIKYLGGQTSYNYWQVFWHRNVERLVTIFIPRLPRSFTQILFSLLSLSHWFLLEIKTSSSIEMVSLSPIRILRMSNCSFIQEYFIWCRSKPFSSTLQLHFNFGTCVFRKHKTWIWYMNMVWRYQYFSTISNFDKGIVDNCLDIILVC